MNRRKFLSAAGLGMSALATPAIAQSASKLQWKLTSSFPKSLATIYGAGEIFSKAVSELTEGRFEIQVYPAGELVPALQALDAVSHGAVEMCHTAAYYYVDKDPTFALATAIPFGLNTRQQQAWILEGGGEKLLNDYFAKQGLRAIACGNTCAQMGGWFRKEINSPQDFAGLKMRIGGFAGQVLQKLGLLPQQIGAGDIYAALAKGTIDAAEWIGPYDDEKLGLNQVAPYYYYPGFWEGGAILHLFVDKGRWEELPPSYQTAVEKAAAFANTAMIARYDAYNPAALKRLVKAGALLRPFSSETLDAAYKAAQETYGEISAKNADFKTIYESLSAFVDQEYAWFKIAEYGYDSAMVRLRANS